MKTTARRIHDLPAGVSEGAAGREAGPPERAPAIESALVRDRLGRVARTVGALADQVGDDRAPRWALCDDLGVAAAAGRRELQALYDVGFVGAPDDETEVIDASSMLAAVAAAVAMAAPGATTITEASGYLLDEDAYVNAALWVAFALRDRYAGLTEADPDPQLEAGEALEALEKPRAEERQAIAGQTHGRGKKIGSGNLPEAIGRRGEVREIVGEAIGESPALAVLQLIDIALRMLRGGLEEDYTHAASAAHAMALAASAPAEAIFPLEAAADAERFGTIDAPRTFLLLARRELEEWMDRAAPAG